MDNSFEATTIDQIRQRLYTLVLNLRRMQSDFLTAEPDKLPSWDTIHGHQKTLVKLFKGLQDLIDKEDRNEFLKSAHLHPTSSFPFQQEDALHNLLRKRLEPEVITWVIKGRATGDAAKGRDKVKVNYQDLWDWAAPAANDVIREVFSAADDEDELVAADGDEMDTSTDKGKAITSGPPSSLAQLMRFSVTGVQGRR